LLGGETAEMPGFYAPGEYDLAGFAVGVVERDELLGSHRVQAGDRILGLASTGLHSNGFSLVRRVLLEDQHLDLTAIPPGFSHPLGDELIQPTRIYVRAALELKQKVELHALAHITGSGLPGNIPRVIPETLAAQVRLGSWPIAPIFDYIQKTGKIEHSDMFQTFNCGVGMVAVLPASAVEAAQEVLEHHRISSWVIGSIVERRIPGEDFFFLPPNT
jgi:phosphoribosylaminoimidazole synthetase